MSTFVAGIPTADARARLLQVGAITVAFVVATFAGLVLEAVGLADASAVYLVAVVVAAAVSGTWAAVGTSIVAFLVYDFLFTTPRFSLEVSDPVEWLSLLLFLLVAVVIGRLTSLLRDRADEADRRSRESVALVAISHDIAMATTFDEAAAAVAQRLYEDAEMSMVWITLEGDDLEGGAGQVVVAATDDPPETAAQGAPWRLMRSGTGGGSDWLRVIDAEPGAPGPGLLASYVIPIDGDKEPMGWIHAVRSPDAPQPGRGARRILTFAADQLAVALRREALQSELNAAEIARHGDNLRVAILDSVSHELRTPIASIRAVAGDLLDPGGEPTRDDVIRGATSIDAEAERLSELVGDLLDMGRIQAGELRPVLEPFDLAEVVETALRRVSSASTGHRFSTRIPTSLPPILIDARLFDVAVGNVLDNAIRHTPPSTRIDVSAARDGEWLVLRVDDDGPGVPPAELDHLFDRFARGPAPVEDAPHARRGLGVGLAIARGFVEAMGGSIEATLSDAGGLSIAIRLRAASGPGGDDG